MQSEIIKKHSQNFSRVTRIKTAHGEITTPTFMPVGTQAGVNCMLPEELKAANSQIILGGNTYHMLCAPGMEVIQAAGGMHRFMHWDGPMLTDSGGFQVFSLSKREKFCEITEEGAFFTHPYTHKKLVLNPETSIKAQKIIGADIIMCFDQCTSDMDDKKLIKQAMDRTHRWLNQSIEHHFAQPNSAYGYPQALFGIIQGGRDKDFRLESTEYTINTPVDGIAIGGESIGFDMQKTREILQWIRPLLPEDKPRYTMGVGLGPQDLIDVVEQGIDLFDCVAPTRNARHGALYCGEIVKKNNWCEFVSEHQNSRIQIKKSCFATDENPIMETCSCYTCQHYSRAELHRLFKAKSVDYSTFACIHNIHVMQAVCIAMQEQILL